MKCDNECKGTYFCHADLMDFASDILIEGERVGSIIGGQALPFKPDPGQFRVIARELGIMENVLAINASIEANRAGRAGVGFAVVAREIGKLAHQSASVYEEIHSLVSEVQNSIRHMDQVDLRSSSKIITR